MLPEDNSNMCIVKDELDAVELRQLIGGMELLVASRFTQLFRRWQQESLQLL